MIKRQVSQIELWNKFNDLMFERGYSVFTHDDEYMGRGSVASKEDKFSPIFNLCLWGGEVPENFVSIHIEDRNGSTILNGDTVAIYSMVDTGDQEKNALVFSKMVDDACEKYGVYSKSNRLDFVFNEMKQDRRTYDETVLSVDERVRNAEKRSAETEHNKIGKEIESDISLE